MKKILFFLFICALSPKFNAQSSKIITEQSNENYFSITISLAKNIDLETFKKSFHEEFTKENDIIKQLASNAYFISTSGLTEKQIKSKLKKIELKLNTIINIMEIKNSKIDLI